MTTDRRSRCSTPGTPSPAGLSPCTKTCASRCTPSRESRLSGPTDAANRPCWVSSPEGSNPRAVRCSALGANICRCTGYTKILAAANEIVDENVNENEAVNERCEQIVQKKSCVKLSSRILYLFSPDNFSRTIQDMTDLQLPPPTFHFLRSSTSTVVR